MPHLPLLQNMLIFVVKLKDNILSENQDTGTAAFWAPTASGVAYLFKWLDFVHVQ